MHEDSSIPDFATWDRNTEPRSKPVDDRFPEELVAKLHRETGQQTDPISFRNRIRHVFMRFEMYLARQNAPSAKVRRKQIARIERQARALLLALDETDRYILERINASFEHSNFESSLSGPVWSTKPPNRNLSDIEQILACVSSLFRIAREQGQDEIATPNGRPRKNAALEQLIEDLAATYEFGTEKSARSQCFYDAKTGQYRGEFFTFAEALIQAYRPETYFSNNALGKLIQRALTEDWD